MKAYTLTPEVRDAIAKAVAFLESEAETIASCCTRRGNPNGRWSDPDDKAEFDDMLATARTLRAAFDVESPDHSANVESRL